MTDFLEHWAGQGDENRRLLAQELLITETTEAIWQAMEEMGVNKSELARLLGVSKGYVSQVLGGSRNMTLRTFADICSALGRKPCVNLEVDRKVESWRSDPEQHVTLGRPRVHYVQTGNIYTPVDGWKRAA